MIDFKELKTGDEAFVDGYIGASEAYRGKLLSMGLTKGTKIKLVKIAPMGDPVELEVRGFKLSLRRDEAEVLKLRREE